MLFTIQNKKYKAIEKLRKEALVQAYFIIQKYPLQAADQIMDNYIQQQYDMSLKDMCVTLLLNMTFYADDRNNLVLLFKNPKYDAMAQLITFGNGAIQGSKILQMAFK